MPAKLPIKCLNGGVQLVQIRAPNVTGKWFFIIFSSEEIRKERGN
jgi:hypothetical protein